MTITYLRAHRQSRCLPATTHAPSAPPPLAGRTLTQPYRDEPWPPIGFAIDPGRRTISVGGRRVELTRREFDLLAHLASHPYQVFTRGQLLNAVWNQPEVGDGRTIDVHIARLRQKLGTPHRDTVATVRGVGYKYEPRPNTASATPT